MLARRAVASASTPGHSGSNSEVYGMSVGGECDKNGWVPSGGVAPLSCWFSAGVVLLSVIYIGSNVLGWVKRSLGWENYTIPNVEIS